jgi:hypothetical protein
MSMSCCGSPSSGEVLRALIPGLRDLAWPSEI